MADDYKFEGWIGHDEASVKGNMVHAALWLEQGPAPYPICVGHEIVGVAVRVGSEASGGIQLGDRVGVGAQSDSCFGRGASAGSCGECDEGSVNYCPRAVHTYGGFHFNGGKTMGGHATYHRCPSAFVIKIPDGLASEDAAPMLCGGVTVYSPLRFHGAGPGKTVGIVGVGGLGHFGVLFARALGADRVVGISRKADKRDEVLQMGADAYISTDGDADWAKENAKSIDIIISTVSSSRMPLQEYLGLLRRDGTFVQVGNPDDGQFSFHPGPLLAGRVKMTGSAIGSPAEIRDMFELSVRKGVKPWVQVRPMADANAAIMDVEEGRPRYRYVLVNEA